MQTFKNKSRRITTVKFKALVGEVGMTLQQAKEILRFVMRNDVITRVLRSHVLFCFTRIKAKFIRRNT